MKFIFSLVGLIFFLSLNAQDEIIKKRVFDIETRSAIPYATVHELNSMRYQDADKEGYFELAVNLLADTLEVSCIGFKSFKATIKTIKAVDSIFLVRQDVTLKEVLLSKPLLGMFGIINEKKGRSSSGGSSAGRPEIATLIKVFNEGKLYKISKVFIAGHDFKAENPVRLHIYDVDSNGLPGNELLNKEVIITNNDNTKNLVSINVQNQNIFLEKPYFFIGIQWMTSTKVKIFTGPEIFETYKNKEMLTFRRSLNVNSNRWYVNYKNNGVWNMVFYPGGKTSLGDVPINMLASAEIEIFSN